MATQLQIKLNNVKLYNEMNKFKDQSLIYQKEKNQAKDLILQYKNALDSKNKEFDELKKEKESLELKYNKIPEFVRNFFEN
ncbi:MAG: hypothetical protein J6J60_10320 [Clostridia bacterium]|nr:hypothetical protein [Clostridia bacterium]